MSSQDKKKYTPPQLIDMNEPKSQGVVCETGSSNIFSCNDGSNAEYCSSGSGV